MTDKSQTSAPTQTSGRRVGLLHPGQMGVTIGAAAKAAGHFVVWASEGRATASRERAEGAQLEDVGTLEALATQVDTILSVCPPDAALEQASAVAQLGFRGTYADLNAVSPERALETAAVIEAAGAKFVDGGIIGPPALKAGTTRVYLSGPSADSCTPLFTNSLVDASVVNDRAGAASALKMCYAAYTKGTSALLIAIRALARAEGVEESLVSEWDISIPGLADRSEKAAAANAFKAWRFVGEMEEIAATFSVNGLPGGFHEGAAGLYRFLESMKDVTPPPTLSEVLDLIDAERLPANNSSTARKAS